MLLILAGVSLSAVFNDKGIFKRAEAAANKYDQAKARETLELTLGEARMQKYDEGLTDEQLTNKINKVGEEVEPGGNEVIVDGYIFEIDRSVPKIVDYVGPADGIIITAVVSNNDSDGWVSEAESKANITGKIKTYSGGKITTANAKRGNTDITGFTIDNDGNYKIDNITDSGTYTIYAEDNKGKNKTKEIEVEVKVDKTAPTVESVNVTTEGNKIKLSATGHDKGANGEEQSGIDHFNYTITPSEGVTTASGTFKKNETAEITVTNYETYTIKVTATDKCGNTTQTATEKTLDRSDTIPPTISNATATASVMKITISAIATDNESGLQSLTYSVSPATIKDGKATGSLTSGEEIEIETTAEGNYTVEFTAKDNANNTSTATAGPVTTEIIMSVAEVKSKVNAGNIREYMGKKVDYKSPQGGTWRIFYIDTGAKFGPVNTIYLKRDFVAEDTKLTLSTKTSETDPAVDRFYKMNPELAGSTAHKPIDQNNEKACVWLCDPTVWNKYKTSESSYAVGSPSVEMYMKAYNQWKGSNNSLVYKLDDTSRKHGYLVGANNSYSNDSGYTTANNTVESGPTGTNIFMILESNWWLASPSANANRTVLRVRGSNADVAWYTYSTTLGVCPIVPLDQ